MIISIILIEMLINEELSTQANRIVNSSVKTYKIVAQGDGIGPETPKDNKGSKCHSGKADFKLDLIYGEAGAHCIPTYGTLPKET